MAPKSRTYEEGKIEGKFEALEAIVSTQTDRIDKADVKISYLEKGQYLFIGAFLIIQFNTQLQAFFGG